MDISNFKFELVKHFTNRKIIQELFQLKNIQTTQKTPQIISDIAEKPKEKEEKLIYGIMKKELLKEFQDFRYLARGAQGYVILAKEKQTNKRFAIKGYIVRDEEGEVEKEQLSDAKKEIEILSQCRGSPYVSNLIKPIDFEENQFLYLVFTEYQGTLQEVIDSTQEKRLNEISAIKYSKDIAEGLLHIHNKGYLVNDLKMDNILIDYCGNAVVSDFGCAQKLKKNNSYAYCEYEGNLYFQAPECVDREIEKLYENEYKKLGVETQMNPSQRSEACSLGYLIYTMVQGKKQTFKFMYEKHKPLEYDNNFKSFKYSKQLEYIIDGLTKFIPKERLSVKEAFEQLKEIIYIEFNFDSKFQIQVSEQTQIFSQNQLKGIEFIEKFDKQYYPIVQNEDSLLKELLSENNSSNELLEKLKQLENENKSLLEDKENSKKILKERKNQISEQKAVSLKNTQEKEQEIIDLKAKVEIQNLEVEKLKNLNSSLQQKQDSLLINNLKKDQDILQIQNQLEFQNKCFLENQDRAQQEIQQLKEKIKENQEKAQKKIQELEEKIQLNSQEGDNRKIQIQQFYMIQELKNDNIPQQMEIQESQQQSMQQQNKMVQGVSNQQIKMTIQSNHCVIFINTFQQIKIIGQLNSSQISNAYTIYRTKNKTLTIFIKKQKIVMKGIKKLVNLLSILIRMENVKQIRLLIDDNDDNLFNQIKSTYRKKQTLYDLRNMLLNKSSTQIVCKM